MKCYGMVWHDMAWHGCQPATVIGLYSPHSRRKEKRRDEMRESVIICHYQNISTKGYARENTNNTTKIDGQNII